VGVIGAGVSGLRCAGLLKQLGFKVTVIEGRDRYGGRVSQQRMPRTGNTVDMGANWIHGTTGNPINDIAVETGTRQRHLDGKTVVFDDKGDVLPLLQSSFLVSLTWDILMDGLRYSGLHSAEINKGESLLDYVRRQIPERLPDTAEGYEEKRKLVLQMAETWGAYVGSHVREQSMKFLWLEDCLGGGQ